MGGEQTGIHESIQVVKRRCSAFGFSAAVSAGLNVCLKGGLVYLLFIAAQAVISQRFDDAKPEDETPDSQRLFHKGRFGTFDSDDGFEDQESDFGMSPLERERQSSIRRLALAKRMREKKQELARRERRYERLSSEAPRIVSQIRMVALSLFTTFAFLECCRFTISYIAARDISRGGFPSIPD